MEPHAHANSVQLILLFGILTLLSSFTDQVTIAVNIIYSCSLTVNQMKHLVTRVYFTMFTRLFIQGKNTRTFRETLEINISHFLLHFYLDIAFMFTLENSEREKHTVLKEIFQSTLNKSFESVKTFSFLSQELTLNAKYPFFMPQITLSLRSFCLDCLWRQFISPLTCSSLGCHRPEKTLTVRPKRRSGRVLMWYLFDSGPHRPFFFEHYNSLRVFDHALLDNNLKHPTLPHQEISPT